MTHVIEINTVEALEDYRLPWNLLLGQTRNASFFQSLDWLIAYWNHFGARQALRVLIVMHGGQPVGILPLCIRREKYKVGFLRVLTYPLHDWGTYFGPVGPNPTATLLAGMRHIQQTERNWDIFDLRWVDKNSLDCGRTRRAMLQAGFSPLEKPWMQIYAVELPDRWETYLSQRTSKWRNNLRRNQRRLAALGEVQLTRYRPAGQSYGEGDPRWDLYDACEQVASRSWQARSTDGTTLSHASIRPFLREAHEKAAHCGMLDMSLLQVAGEPVAFAYNYHNQGRVHGLRSGFDSSFTQTGCGNVLIARLLEDSIAREDTWYDLGPGSMNYKHMLTEHTETCYRYAHFPATAWRAQAIRAKQLFFSLWKTKTAQSHNTASGGSQSA